MGAPDSSNPTAGRSNRKHRSRSGARKTVNLNAGGGALPIQCQYCSGQSFRRSRLRGEDFWQLFLMRYPVRCLRCSQRQMVSFTVAGLSLSSLTHHPRPARTEDSWKHWTEPSESSAHVAMQPPRRDE
ncbi:hypothetical protein GCM10011507_20850 [Edaphobacter acidisoli]|uniref:Uncharacterized protein n=1 Tax=Edaphobacter acidisoli TaxID=2040573 RepID=A0A916RT97_9BACT|nr:hypothetical protein GCM10011507_20850 [Edaphobacter acidisoli]